MEGLRRPMDQCEPGAELPQLSQPSYVVPSGGLALSKKGPSSDADDEGDAADVHQPPGLSLRGPPDDSDDRDRDRRSRRRRRRDLSSFPSSSSSSSSYAESWCESSFAKNYAAIAVSSKRDVVFR